MPERIEAAVIAIGSELTAGQITNRNAAWISDHLFKFGVDCRYHLTVEDNLEDILSALKFVDGKCKYVFCTGGLGPTSDDITRNAIAKFVGEDLVFDVSSWERIEEFFGSLGRVAAETNRQQCYFPESAVVLENAVGTANAFYMQRQGQKLIVLPGPPREIARVWEDHIAKLIDAGPEWVVRKWRTIGQGESDLATLIVPIVSAGAKVVDIAYRAHAPYIETKIKYPKSQEASYRGLCREVKSCLLPWLFEEDEESHADQLAGLLARFDNSVIDDTATHGQLGELLSPAMRRQGTLKTSLLTSWDLTPDPEEYLKESLQLADDTHVALGLAGFSGERHYAVGLKTDSSLEIELFPSPYPGAKMMHRNQLAIAGLALKTWVRWLSDHHDLPYSLS